MLNPVVQRAMQALTSRINTSSGLTDPKDRAAAVGILERLRSAGEDFEPESVAAWASLNGWTPKGVAQIRLVANDVMLAKEPGGHHAAWSPDIVEKLRGEAGVEKGR
jgi:hypothetical protein